MTFDVYPPGFVSVISHQSKSKKIKKFVRTSDLAVPLRRSVYFIPGNMIFVLIVQVIYKVYKLRNKGDFFLRVIYGLEVNRNYCKFQEENKVADYLNVKESGQVISFQGLWNEITKCVIENMRQETKILGACRFWFRIQFLVAADIIFSKFFPHLLYIYIQGYRRHNKHNFWSRGWLFLLCLVWMFNRIFLNYWHVNYYCPHPMDGEGNVFNLLVQGYPISIS